jgi:hypothetical protein
MLRLTPNQAQTLVAEGKLEAAGRISFKHGIMEMYLKEQVQALVECMPQIKRRWNDEQAARLGAKKAAYIREKQWRKAQILKTRKLYFLDSLSELPERTAAIFRVCYYLYHLNHYAKQQGHAYLYDYKETILYALWKEQLKLITLGYSLLNVFFIPGAPRIHLCLDCRVKAQRQGLSHLEFLRAKEHVCTQCGKEDNYYSLYEFILENDEYHFCFHLPYASARKWLVDFNIPEKESAAENKRDGFSAFGRPINEAEANAVELQEIIEELEMFLKNS